MKIAKLPYLFYFMQKVNIQLENNHSIIIRDKKYSLIKKNKFIFLLLRYVPIFLLFYMVFNKYDFTFDNVKIMQYIISIILFLSVITLKKWGVYLSGIALLLIGVFSLAGYLNVNDMSMQYISKYLILIYVIYDLSKNYNCSLYEIQENGNIKSHLIIKGDNE